MVVLYHVHSSAGIAQQLAALSKFSVCRISELRNRDGTNKLPPDLKLESESF